MIDGKDIIIKDIININNWIGKKYIMQMSEYFPKPKFERVNVKVKSDLSNYATNETYKMQEELIHQILPKKTDLANLKSDIDRLHIQKLKVVPCGLTCLKSKVDKSDIGKLESTPVDLSKLSAVEKNDVVKRTEYNELVKKVNKISTTDTRNLVKKLVITQKLMRMKIK